jgi:uncharacterized membrane protein HdeD (DUF308 family)
MKYLHILLALVFALFAALQWNDPDPIPWMAVYGAVAVLCALAVAGRFPQWPTRIVAAAIAVWAILLAPGFIAWVRDGMPSITGAMQAESEYIEEVREFLGLVLALLAVLHLRPVARWSAMERPVAAFTLRWAGR